MGIMCLVLRVTCRKDKKDKVTYRIDRIQKRFTCLIPGTRDFNDVKRWEKWSIILGIEEDARELVEAVKITNGPDSKCTHCCKSQGLHNVNESDSQKNQKMTQEKNSKCSKCARPGIIF